MFLYFFLNSVFSQPTKPAGWEKRTDAKPYLAAAASGAPIIAEALGDRPVDAGWDLHVRTAPAKDADDWRARVPVTAVPISFRSHIRAWPSDEWVYYQLIGRVTVTPGNYKFGLSFVTGDAGVGCFADMRIGGVNVVQADTKAFFAKRAPKSSERDEIMFTGDVALQGGDYDAVATVGCHPGKMGQVIEASRLNAWKSTKFAFVVQKPGEGIRILRTSEVSHLK